MEFACFPPVVALFHMAYGITTSVLLMEIMFFDFCKVPFTCAHLPGKINLVFLGVMYIFGFSAYSSTLRNLESRLTGSPIAALAFFALAAALYITIARYRRIMLGPKPALDYLDPAEPIVRTLDLSTR
jgi:hypothetical protein